jgi:hypothetical protein
MVSSQGSHCHRIASASRCDPHGQSARLSKIQDIKLHISKAERNKRGTTYKNFLEQPLQLIDFDTLRNNIIRMV